MDRITAKTIKHLAELARIELNKDEEKNLEKDFKKILDYFTDLQKLDTSNVDPEISGAFSKNVFRSDIPTDKYKGHGKESFPEDEKGFLKVPKIL